MFYDLQCYQGARKADNKAREPRLSDLNSPAARFIRQAVFISRACSEYVIPINAYCPRLSLARQALPRRENSYLSKGYPE